MNSLVVFLSVVALAAAEPSGLLRSALAYSAPAVVLTPAAVSQQSRVDIQSSPAVLATAVVAPAARAVLAQPAVYAAPAAIATSVAVAPAAISSQARVDIKSSPAVVSSVAYGVPLAYSTPTAYNAAVLTGAYAPAAIATTGALAAPSVPLDTPEVIAARAAHLQAKALTEAHLIHKRSAPLIATAPVVSSYAAASPIIPTYAASPIAYAAPITRVATPIVAGAYGVHPW